MAEPTIRMSLEEIRKDAKMDIAFFESTAARHTSWEWPVPMLSFAREFQTLASESPLDQGRIRGFRARLHQHIREQRLKGMEPFIWRAEALEALAPGGENA